jgi:ubiquinol-cytochrome c reductase cytochrome b subunit
MKLIKINPI